MHADQNSIERCHEANIIDRETLQFTVKLVRPRNPSLALRIQNIIAPGSSSRISGNDIPQAADLFVLDFDSFSLKRIVETLGDSALEMAEYTLQTHQGDEEELLQTKQVMDKWLAYARQHQLYRPLEKIAS